MSPAYIDCEHGSSMALLIGGIPRSSFLGRTAQIRGEERKLTMGIGDKSALIAYDTGEFND